MQRQARYFPFTPQQRTPLTSSLQNLSPAFSSTSCGGAWKPQIFKRFRYSWLQRWLHALRSCPLALASPHTLPTNHHRQHRQQAPSSTMTVITRSHKPTGHDDASSYVHPKLRAYNKDPEQKKKRAPRRTPKYTFVPTSRDSPPGWTPFCRGSSEWDSGRR